MSMTLYDITEERRALMARLLENGGEVTPEIETDLLRLDIDERTKAYNYAAQIAEWEGEIAELRGQVAKWQDPIDKLRQKIRTRENSIKSLEGRMLAHLKALGKKTLDTGSVIFGSWNRRDNTRPAIIALVDLRDVPMEFLRLSLDKDAAYEAWKRGELPDVLEAKFGEHVRLT